MGRKDLVANWLSRASEAESYAAGTAVRLALGTLLLPEEKDFAGDVVYREEMVHRDLFRAMTRSLAVETSPAIKRQPLDEQDELKLLMYMTRGEGLILLHIKTIEEMMDGDKWFLANIAKVEADEKGHRAWSRRIVHRLHNSGVAIPTQVLKDSPTNREMRVLALEAIRATA